MTQLRNTRYQKIKQDKDVNFPSFHRYQTRITLRLSKKMNKLQESPLTITLTWLEKIWLLDRIPSIMPNQRSSLKNLWIDILPRDLQVNMLEMVLQTMRNDMNWKKLINKQVLRSNWTENNTTITSLKISQITLKASQWRMHLIRIHHIKNHYIKSHSKMHHTKSLHSTKTTNSQLFMIRCHSSKTQRDIKKLLQSMVTNKLNKSNMMIINGIKIQVRICKMFRAKKFKKIINIYNSP